MKQIAKQTHKWLVLFIGVGTWVQMFLAGIWHAEVVSTPEAHVFFGLGLLASSLLALIAAAVAGLPKKYIVQTAVLFVLILLQPILIEQRRMGLPILSAFHTLNAAFVGMTAGALTVMVRGGSHVERDSEKELSVALGD